VSARDLQPPIDPREALDSLAERYVAVWNEPDAAMRRRSIEALWTSEGANVTRTLQARGHDQLEARVGTSYEKWVRDGGCIFRLHHAAAHHDVAQLVWEMVSISDGCVISVGVDFLVLAEDGRIRTDYQFIQP
jgi:hypothetical protein